MSCRKERSIHNKKKNTPDYIASDCYGSVILGTNRKPFVSIEKFNSRGDSWPVWKPYKGYKKYVVVDKPDKITDKCNAYKYKTGGWKNDLLSPPYDPLDCKGLKLLGNDGNLWEVHVGTGPDSFYLPTSWRIVPQLKKKSKKVVKKPKKIVKKKTQLKKKSKKVVKKTKKLISKKSKREGRPSPSVSATLFPVGTTKTGGDGNMWEVVENKNGVKRWKRV